MLSALIVEGKTDTILAGYMLGRLHAWRFDRELADEPRIGHARAAHADGRPAHGATGRADGHTGSGPLLLPRHTRADLQGLPGHREPSRQG